ncbi:hypothetical protein phiK7A1_156 [Pseudomonas phage phiK7A1]|uniref:Uncharacterized protein n=1 Tax=Pseudomonas phage phiK7A1 TaxID=2759194 RepID=A0A7H0XG04_9CAUD|nr:hypothetical protein phiK7A1_156 [Pseudomonas phage phiK7A1]
MPHVELTMDDLKGTRALMQAADYIIGFKRIEVPNVEQKPCTLYRYFRDADGNIQCEVVGVKMRPAGPRLFNYDPSARIF